MKIAHPSASRQTGFTRICSVGFLFVLLLNGCALPSPTPRAAIYDFGPGPLSTRPNSDSDRLPPLVIEMVNANPALDSTAMLYRLAYADSQQLRPYSLARWSMTPTQLLRQRLRDHLGQRYALLTPDDDGQSAGARALVRQQTLTLRIELEEFGQLFSTPESSVGLLRLRVTAARGGGAVSQRSVIVQRSSPSPDAPGGVRALTAAADAAAQEMDQWLQELGHP